MWVVYTCGFEGEKVDGERCGAMIFFLSHISLFCYTRLAICCISSLNSCGNWISKHKETCMF